MDEQQYHRYLRSLASKWEDGTITQEEKLLFNQWYHSVDDLPLDKITAENPEYLKERLYANIVSREHIYSVKPWYRRNISLVYYFAAVLALVFVAYGYFFYRPSVVPKKNTVAMERLSQIGPGSNKAILTLSDGSSIVLNQQEKGILSRQGNIAVNGNEGELSYENSENKSGSDHPGKYNTVTTPRGGQYQVRLSDGTIVWLNAASSLKFPVSFSADRRVVELKGEAYFEVNRNPLKGNKHARVPFLVKTNNQTIEVLGTHFNVNAYEDEPEARTTLLEGSVKVMEHGSGRPAMLKPGQQAVTGQGQTRVLNVDAAQAIAWQEGYFVFDNESAESMMRQISRWYNVDVVYSGNIRYRTFGGRISKFENISEVLHLMEQTNVIHFRTEGRRVTVMP